MFGGLSRSLAQNDTRSIGDNGSSHFLKPFINPTDALTSSSLIPHTALHIHSISYSLLKSHLHSWLPASTMFILPLRRVGAFPAVHVVLLLPKCKQPIGGSAWILSFALAHHQPAEPACISAIEACFSPPRYFRTRPFVFSPPVPCITQLYMISMEKLG